MCCSFTVNENFNSKPNIVIPASYLFNKNDPYS